MAKSAKGNLVKALYEKHAGAKRDVLPEGKFVAQFRALNLEMDSDEPKARLNGVIARGENKGKQFTKFYRFDDRTTQNGTEIDGEAEFIRFMEDLGSLGIDTSEIKLEELASVVKEDKPLAQISIRVNGQYSNISILSPVESDEDDEDADDEGDDEEDDEEEDDDPKPAPKAARGRAPAKPAGKKAQVQEEEEEEEDDEEEDDDADDEESAEPKKGDSCVAKPSGMKKPSLFTIKSVNKAKKTVDLVHDATGKAYPGIAWSAIELSEDDE